MLGTCRLCRKEKDVQRNAKSGKLVCKLCYKREISSHEKCSKCGLIRGVGTRSRSGQPTCHNPKNGS
jgi:hypothetical protein